VGVYITDAAAVKLPRPYEAQDFIMFGHRHRAQLLEELKRRISIREISASEFTNHERMHYNDAATKTLGKFRKVFAKVVNPDRGVGKDHVAAAGARLLGTDSSLG
jgi:hypothetical protein